MTAKTFSLADALAQCNPVTWQTDRIFPVGSVALVFGAPGSKKTYSMIDLAVCTALGKDWLEQFPCKQGAVLIVDEESGPRRLMRRMAEVARGHLTDGNTPVYATSLESFNFWSGSAKHGAAELERVIKQHSAKVVIIDALADVMLGGDENAVKDAQRVFHALRSVAEATGAVIILIHHSLKNGNGYRGSSAILGALDVAIEVVSDEKSTLVKFRTTKARDSEPTGWAGECHFGPGEFWMTGAQAAAGTGHKYEKGERLVMTAIIACGNTATSAQIETATGYASSTVRNIVSQLVRLGGLTRVDGGGAGTPGTYRIDMLWLMDNPL